MSHGAAEKRAKNGARKARALKVARRPEKTPRVVVVSRPTSAEATRKAFGIGARRWQHIQDLVDEVLG